MSARSKTPSKAGTVGSKPASVRQGSRAPTRSASQLTRQSRSVNETVKRTVISRAAPSRPHSPLPRYSTNTSLTGRPEVIGAAIQQMATPRTDYSGYKSSPSLVTERTGISPSKTGSSLPTRNTHTCNVTKLCLASTVAPTKTGLTPRSATRKPVPSRSKSVTKSSRTKAPTEFKTYKPVRSIKPLKAPSKSSTKIFKSKTGKSYTAPKKYTKYGTGARTCPGDTQGPWNPVSQTGLKSVTKSGRSRSGRSRASSMGSRGSQYDEEEQIVYYDQQKKKSSCTSSLCFWLLIILALALLLFLILYFTIFHNSGVSTTRDETTVVTTGASTGAGGNVSGSGTGSGSTGSGGSSHGSGKAFYQVRGDRLYTWSWNNNGTMKPYHIAVSWYIEQQQRGGYNTFLIDIGNDQVFEIDIRERKQYSLKWDQGKGHRARGRNYVRTGKYRSMERTSTPGKQAGRFTPAYHWQWKNDSGYWKAYTSQVSDWMEACQKFGVKNPIIDIGHDMVFKIDFNPRNPKQMSLKWNNGSHKTGYNGYKTTGKSRQIRQVSGRSPNNCGSQKIRISVK